VYGTWKEAVGAPERPANRVADAGFPSLKPAAGRIVGGSGRNSWGLKGSG